MICLLAAFMIPFIASAAENTAKPAKPEFFPPVPADKQYKLVWNDEFDGNKLDETKWDIPEGPRRDGFWRRDAVRLDGKGNLAIDAFMDGDKFIDGCVRTRGKFEHAYGYYVARVKLQTQPGHWSAFWLYNASESNIGNGGTDGAEIDIYEKPWLDFKVNHAVHWDGYGPEHKQVSNASFTPGIMRGFHTYALLWTPEEYKFYIDGIMVWKTDGGGVCTKPLYIKLSDEIGDWAGDIRKAKLPDSFLVDYVRVYDIVPK